MKSGHGSFRTNCTVCGSTVLTSLTCSWSSAPLARSKLNLTSSAVNGSPLWNLTPSQFEFIGQLVRALAPRFSESRRHLIARHRFDERVVQRVEDPERCQHPLR